MLFSSTIFLFLFLPLVLLVYYVLMRRRLPRNLLLLFASLFFYAWGEPRFVLVMLLSVVANYGFGLWVHRAGQSATGRKTALVVSVVFNLVILFVFKYLNFTISNLNAVLPFQLQQTDIRLPIGISFFTFQAMSYVFDVYNDTAEVQKNPLYVGLYIAFFPQLIAGPIVRYETVAQQIKERQENFEDFSAGVSRFLVGFCKKVLLANTLAVVADAAFNNQDFAAMPALMSILGVVAYALQIYYDFSGYSDMAIGLGRMFGFKFLENFNYPYISGTVSEFWRRWHISLGTWFRDYVYFPLGGSRVRSKARLTFNLFVVWMLTGIWHGASWTFVAWGMLYFVLIAFEKLTGITQKLAHAWQRILYRVFTLGCVMFGWVLFRAEDIRHAFRYLKNILCLTGNAFYGDVAGLYLREYAFIFAAGLLFCLPVLPALQKKLAMANGRVRTVAQSAGVVVLFVGFILSVAYLAKGSYNPFIYFNF